MTANDPRDAHEPLVSVIIPTFRRPGLLTRAISSVIDQSYTNWEILVVDDNDADSPARADTRAFMRQHDGEARIRYLEHDRNRGLPAARNTGIAASAGTLVAFLDDDDAWLPEKLAEQVAVFGRDASIELVYTGRLVVDGEGRLIRTTRADGRALERDALLVENSIGTPSSVVCRRDALLAVGSFDEDLPSLEDWDLYLRLSGAFGYVEEPLIAYYQHDAGRMMENYGTLAQAHEVIYRKNRDEFTTKPKPHVAFLRRHAKVLLRAGQRRPARRLAWRSLQVRALDRGTWKLVLQLELGEEPVESLRRRAAPLRKLFGPRTPSGS